MERDDTKRLAWKAGLVAGVPVAQQTPYATAELYEVEESINCNPSGGPNPVASPLCLQQTSNGFGTRIAQATVEGGVGGFPGGVTGPPVFSGGITVQAMSIISKVDWNGPAHGSMQVDALPTVFAHFAGQLDLSLMVKSGVPLAPISGKWNGQKGFSVGGTFAGVFEIPFGCPNSPSGACYLENGVVVPAPIPLVKLVVTFFN